VSAELAGRGWAGPGCSGFLCSCEHTWRRSSAPLLPLLSFRILSHTPSLPLVRSRQLRRIQRQVAADEQRLLQGDLQNSSPNSLAASAELAGRLDSDDSEAELGTWGPKALPRLGGGGGAHAAAPGGGCGAGPAPAGGGGGGGRCRHQRPQQAEPSQRGFG
jgi:hypothetical protein